MGRIATGLGCALALGAASCGGAAVEEARPPVIVYLVDTLRPDRLGLYGYERNTSPNLAAFARDAVVFEDAYAPSAWTKASVASLLTGLDPLRHGVRSRRHRVPDRVPLLGERLRELGYRCAAVLTNPHVIEHWGFARACDPYVDLGAETRRWNIRADDVNRACFELLDGLEAGPLYLYVHTIDPHSPYDPTPPYDTLFVEDPLPGVVPERVAPDAPEAVHRNLRAMYDSEVRFADAEFGRFLDGLRERGLYDDALIVFASDHGDEHFEHGGAGHGHQLFDEVVRVPLVVKFPGGRHGGRRVAARASLLDVVPTVLGALGAPAADELDGVDLRGALTEGTLAPRPLYLDLDLVRFDGRRHVARGVVAEHFKYVEALQPTPGRYLFDLRADPGEQTNLLATHAELGASLAADLRRHVARHAAGLHLKLASDPSRTGQSVIGELRTTGRFGDVAALELEAEDRWSLADDRRALTFELVLRDFAQRSTDDVAAIRDVDELVVQVEPSDSPVTLASLRWQDGADVRVHPPGQRVLRLSAPELVAPAVLPAGQRLAPGAHVFVVPEPEEAPSEAPAGITERLRALGY